MFGNTILTQNLGLVCRARDRSAKIPDSSGRKPGPTDRVDTGQTKADIQTKLRVVEAKHAKIEAMVKQGLVTKSDALLASVRAGEVDAQLAEAAGAASDRWLSSIRLRDQR